LVEADILSRLRPVRQLLARDPVRRRSVAALGNGLLQIRGRLVLHGHNRFDAAFVNGNRFRFLHADAMEGYHVLTPFPAWNPVWGIYPKGGEAAPDWAAACRPRDFPAKCFPPVPCAKSGCPGGRKTPASPYRLPRRESALRCRLRSTPTRRACVA